MRMRQRSSSADAGLTEGSSSDCVRSTGFTPMAGRGVSGLDSAKSDQACTIVH